MKNPNASSAKSGPKVYQTNKRVTSHTTIIHIIPTSPLCWRAVFPLSRLKYLIRTMIRRASHLFGLANLIKLCINPDVITSSHFCGCTSEPKYRHTVHRTSVGNEKLGTLPRQGGC